MIGAGAMGISDVNIGGSTRFPGMVATVLASPILTSITSRTCTQHKPLGNDTYTTYRLPLSRSEH